MSAAVQDSTSARAYRSALETIVSVIERARAGKGLEPTALETFVLRHAQVALGGDRPFIPLTRRFRKAAG